VKSLRNVDRDAGFFEQWGEVGLAEPGCAADLAGKIAQCLREPRALGRYARSWVEERFGWTAIATRLLRRYEEVLGRNISNF